jgi:hypothetical protein
MALNKNAAAGIYLSIAEGRIVRSYKEEVPGTTKQRITKTGKVTHEEFFSDIIGHLVSLETKENDYGKQWQLKMQDGEDTYIVSMPFSSRYSTSFLKALPNVDLAAPVKLFPWSMIDKNDASKKVTGITLYQNDGNGFVKVLPAYTKESPGGLPQMVQVKVKGQMTWDDSDMMEFLEKMAKEKFATKPAISSPANEGSEEAPF